MAKKKQPTSLEFNCTPDEKMTARMNYANEALESWHKESDRGAGLVVFSHLETVLGDLLRRLMIAERSKELEDAIMEYPGPLSAGSTRIDMAFLLGCIGPKTHRDLKRMKDIRNRFAHSRTHIGFDEAQITAWCESLHFGKCPGRPGVRFCAKDQFLMAGGMILLQLWKIMDDSVTPKIGRDNAPAPLPAPGSH